MLKTSVTSRLSTTTSYSVDKFLTQHTLEDKNCTNLRYQVFRTANDQHETNESSKLNPNQKNSS